MFKRRLRACWPTHPVYLPSVLSSCVCSSAGAAPPASDLLTYTTLPKLYAALGGGPQEPASASVGHQPTGTLSSGVSTLLRYGRVRTCTCVPVCRCKCVRVYMHREGERDREREETQTHTRRESVCACARQCYHTALSPPWRQHGVQRQQATRLWSEHGPAQALLLCCLARRSVPPALAPLPAAIHPSNGRRLSCSTAGQHTKPITRRMLAWRGHVGALQLSTSMRACGWASGRRAGILGAMRGSKAPRQGEGAGDPTLRVLADFPGPLGPSTSKDAVRAAGEACSWLWRVNGRTLACVLCVCVCVGVRRHAYAQAHPCVRLCACVRACAKRDVRVRVGTSTQACTCTCVRASAHVHVRVCMRARRCSSSSTSAARRTRARTPM